MKVILASQNQHKLVELSAILSQLGFEIALESEYGLHVDVDETGTTFEENSLLKAEAVMKASGMPVLADDSGLMVDALDGAPGVYSARYGHKSSDAERIAYLLENLKDVPAERRTANGSDEPVGGSSIAKMPQTVSSLSAIATHLPTTPDGSSSPAKRGR